MCCKKKEKEKTTFKDVDNALCKYYTMYGQQDRFHPSNEEYSIFLKFIYENDYFNENELESQLGEDADIETCKYLKFDFDNFPCYNYTNIPSSDDNNSAPSTLKYTSSSVRYEIIFEVLQSCYLNKKPPSKSKSYFDRLKYIGLMSWEIIGPFGYYLGLYANYQVIMDYVGSEQYGYCAITGIAIFGGLMANAFYANTALSIYEKHSFCFSFIISLIYGTPFYLLFYLLILQCQQKIYNKHKYENIIDADWNRYSLIINFFESPILECIQIYIVGQYILYSDDTRKLNNIAYPSDNIEFYWLLYACYKSFRGLSDAAWSRIEPMINSVNGEVNGRSKLQRMILFRVRAFIETLLRALRFMMISSIYGGLIGFMVLIIEIIWKYSLVSCCACITNKIRGNSDKLPIGFKIYLIATWLIFSHERFQSMPYFMRILDIFIWTILCVVFSIIGAYIHYELPSFIQNSFIGRILYKVEINGICNQFGSFKNDCYPIEILIFIAVLLIILVIIYRLSPSIFLLAKVTGEQQQIKQQKRNEMMKINSTSPTSIECDPDDYIARQEIMINTMNDDKEDYIAEQMSMIVTMNQQNEQKQEYSNSASKEQIEMIATQQLQQQLPPQQDSYIDSQMEMINTMNDFPKKKKKKKRRQHSSTKKERKPKLDYIGKQRVMINKMNQPTRSNNNYIQSQMVMIDQMNKKQQKPLPPPNNNYIQSQMAMINTMNQHQPQMQQIQMQQPQRSNYIQSQMLMINTMNQHQPQMQQMQMQQPQRSNYIQSQMQMINTMNEPQQQMPNYINSQMAMIDTMNHS